MGSADRAGNRELRLGSLKKKVGDRVWLIDEIRGFSIIMMVVYHTLFDLVVLFGVEIPAFYSPFVSFLVTIFGGVFVFISGSACLYSHSNLRRGGICFGMGLLLTAGTLLVMPQDAIWFGILHMLGMSMMLFPLFFKLMCRIPPWAGILGCFLLFSFVSHTQDGFWGWGEFFKIPLPRMLYDLKWLFWLGFPPDGFLSADYFPLLPWLFCFLAGGFFGVLLKQRRLPAWVYLSHFRPLAFVGRHTLVIYLLHQPIVYALLWVIFQATGAL